MSAIIEAAGWTLLHFLWQGAVLGALFALILWVVKRAHFRYLAGCLAMLMMVVAVAGTFAHHYEPDSPEEPPIVQAPGSEGPESANPLLSDLFPVSGRCRPCHLSVQEGTAESGEQVVYCPSLEQVAGASPPVGESLAEAEEKDGVAIADEDEERSELSWMVGLWLGGVLLMCVRLLCSWILAERLRKREIEPLDRGLMMTMRRVAGQVGVSRPVQIVKSAVVTVPTVVGWLKPVILLPAASIAGLSPGQLQAVLAHELAHIRRHDYLVNLLQHTVETLLFFHPAVWWVSRVVRQEREHCCDDVAVAAAGGALDYAQALATLEELRAEPPSLVLAANGGSLLARIRRLTGMENGRSAAMIALPIVILLGALAVPLVVIGSKSNTEDGGRAATTSKSPAKSEQPQALTAQQAVLGLRHLLAKKPETDLLFHDFVLLAKALEQADIVKLLDEVGRQKDGYKPWTRMALYREWAHRDRDAALAHFLGKHSKRGWGRTAHQAVYAIWSGSRPEDPREALNYLREIPNDPQFHVEGAAHPNYLTFSNTGWVKTAYERVFEELARVDAEIAWRELPTGEHARSNYSYVSMVRGFFRGLEDGATIEKYLSQLKAARGEMMGIGIASVWMNHDFAAALEWAPPQRTDSVGSVMIYGVKGNAVIAWARENPEAALEMIRENSVPEWRNQMAQAVVQGNPHLLDDLGRIYGEGLQTPDRNLEALVQQASGDRNGSSRVTPPISISTGADSRPAIHDFIMSTLSDNARLQDVDYFPEPGITNRPPDYEARYASYHRAIMALSNESQRRDLLATLNESFKAHLPEEHSNQQPSTIR